MKVARLESELEKCRLEGNWAKAVDLARQLSTGKSTGLGESEICLHFNQLLTEIGLQFALSTPVPHNTSLTGDSW